MLPKEVAVAAVGVAVLLGPGCCGSRSPPTRPPFASMTAAMRGSPAALRAIGGVAASPGAGCCEWLSVLLPAWCRCERFAGDATGRRWRCCEPSSAVLPAVDGVSASPGVRCCECFPAVLPTVGGVAAIQGVECFKRFPTVLPTVDVVAASSGVRWVAGAAVPPHEKMERCCYKSPRRMLRAATADATSLNSAAACVLWLRPRRSWTEFRDQADRPDRLRETGSKEISRFFFQRSVGDFSFYCIFSPVYVSGPDGHAASAGGGGSGLPSLNHRLSHYSIVIH